MERKPLMSVEELIQLMKDKGIQFNIDSEEFAMHFMKEHNYYFKLASYRKNYEKSESGSNEGKYINLEFAYLRDLSTIDCKLRYILLEMCLDVEHALKTMLLEDAVDNPSEDGYTVVGKWLSFVTEPTHIYDHRTTSYCKELIDKYEDEFPLWVFLEIVSFGEFCKFIQYYNQLYPNRIKFNTELVFPVRDVRNAAAHSNCIINDVAKRSDFQPTKEIVEYVKNIDGIGKRARNRYMHNKPIHDVVALLYLYPLVVKSEELRKHRRAQLRKLLKVRARKHLDYYKSNGRLMGVYSMIIHIFQKVEKMY